MPRMIFDRRTGEPEPIVARALRAAACLSEAPILIVSFMVSTIGILSESDARHGVPAHLRCTPVLLFSCQKTLRGTECLRYYVRAIIFVFFVTKNGVESLIIKRQ